MIVACLLLGISGGIRFWRDRQFATLAQASSLPPFRLNEMPRVLGEWRSDPAMDGRLEKEISQLAGAKDSAVRTYLDEKSGDQLTALFIYGLADKVYAHKPDICYPSAGYRLVAGPVDRELIVPGIKDPVRYRWAIYMKRVGGIGYYQEAYHTFYYNGEWTPDAGNRWKMFRYHPGIHKIQLARTVTSLSDEVHGPSESLLSALALELRNRVDAATGKALSAPGTPAPQPAAPQGAGSG
jgi:hypothetical protein